MFRRLRCTEWHSVFASGAAPKMVTAGGQSNAEAGGTKMHLCKITAYG